MTVQIESKETPLTAEQIEAIQQMLGVVLPRDYREFLSYCNVGIPEKNQIVTSTVTTSVSEFFGQSEINIYDLISEAKRFASRLPSGVLPIASAAAGNLICLQLDTGAVFWWDHEEEAGDGEAPSYNNLEIVAPTFSNFLVAMQPRKPIPPINLKGASVWKRPGADEKFKDYLIKKK